MGKFNAKKCTMILKLAANRLNIHKAKKIEQSISRKKDIADMLAAGKRDQAKIMTGNIIHEDYTIETLYLIEIYCNTIVQRIDLLEASKQCHEQLKEAVCSLIYAAPYLENDAKFGEPELMKVRKMFIEKFSKKFPADCIESRCVNPKLLTNLAGTRSPSQELLEFYLNAISNKGDLHPLSLLEHDKIDSVQLTATAFSNLEIVHPEPQESNVVVATPFNNGLEGIVSFDANNNAFVLCERNREVQPIFIPPAELNGAQNGDAVVTQLIPRPDGKSVGKIVKVTAKAPPPRQINGKIQLDSSNNSFINDPENSQQKIFISELNGAEKGDTVQVQVNPMWKRDAPQSGKVLKIVEKAPKEFTGVLTADTKGNNWIVDPQNKYKPVYVFPEDMGSSQNGDVVLVSLNPPRADGNVTGKVISIVKRAQQPREVTARLRVDTKGHSWVIDQNNKEKPIFIPPQDLNDAKDGDMVLARALPPNPQGQVVGKILSVLEKAPQPYEEMGLLEVTAQGGIVHPKRSNALTPGTMRKSDTSQQKQSFDQKPIMISNENMNGAKNGDLVTVLTTPKEGNLYGKVISIVAKGAFREGTKISSRGMTTAKDIPWENVIVLDNGSGNVKAGFANEEKPRAIFPSVVGRPMSMPGVSSPSKSLFVGEEAMTKRGLLQLNYPLEHGIVSNWEDLEAVWAHTFHNVLKVDSKEHPVLLTEAPRNPRQNREKMMEIMFEKFEVPASYIAIQAVLSLYACGMTTGLVLDSGDGVTHTVPIYEGFALSHAIGRLNMAGRDITDYLSILLNERGLYHFSIYEKEIVKQMKEQLAYVAEDFTLEMKKPESELEKNFTLPDGKTVKIGSERFRCSEALFQPTLLGKDIGGVQHLTYKTVMGCDFDVRKPLFENVVLSGGSTCYPGYDKRIQKELNTLLSGSPNIKVNIKTVVDRKYAVWYGGSVLAGLYSFRSNWVTRAEYDEEGASVVHRKCL